MNHDLANEVSLAEWQAKSKLQKMTDETLHTILELIRVARSSSDPINSAIFQKLLSGRPIHLQASNEKYELQLSLGLYKRHSQTSDT